MSQTKLPIEFSYKVTDNFYAGTYPFAKESEDGMVKLNCLIDFGITHFIDLTEPPDRLTKYSEFLPKHCTYMNLPTEDCTIPSFQDLKKAHDFISQSKEKVYLHCKGGFDRTGVAVATYFIYQGKTADEAKRLYLQKAKKQRTRYPGLPLIEKKWEVLEEYEQFLKTKTVEINHHAVRTLWEGLNENRQFRRVLYLPYVDGYVMLLVTDADGNTVESFRDTDICNRYLPSKYNDDVSSEYRKTVPDLEWQLGYTKYGGAELAQFLPFARIEGEKHKYVITISTNKPLAAVDIFINGVDVSVDGVADGKIIMSITVKDMMQRPYAYFNAFPFVLDQPDATDETEKTCEFLWGGILGLAVADALGVPVEFQSRESLRRNPVTEMRGHGTYKQPPGTWSDDTSLTLCLLDSLANKKIDWKVQRPFQPDYADTMQRFLSWADKAEYTAHGTVFDIGIATRKALQRFKEGTDPLECGGTLEQDNGNGSLMRILPLAFYLYSVIGEDFMIKEESIKIINEVSSLTHAHKRSQIACGIYLSVAQQFFDKAWFVGWDWRRSEEDWENAIRAGLKSAIHAGLEWTEEYYKSKTEYAKELKHYKRLFKKNFAKLPEEKIKSSGYVVDTLEAAIWCLLNTDNYKDCVLKAVNLGEDTDTVAAVAGGLAGMYYGVEGIPKKWLKKLARRDYIEKLCGNFGIAHIIGWNQDSYFAYSNSER